MTIEELKQMDVNLLTPAQAAEVLGISAQSIRVCARQRPDLLGFPVMVYGSRVKVPRLPLIDFLEGKEK
nr:MAG TPA: Pyocin activator protein PrtN [Caudoviricetes sp.]